MAANDLELYFSPFKVLNSVCPKGYIILTFLSWSGIRNALNLSNKVYLGDGGSAKHQCSFITAWGGVLNISSSALERPSDSNESREGHSSHALHNFKVVKTVLGQCHAPR